MTKEASAIAQALFDRHHYLRDSGEGRPSVIEDWVISYTRLCEEAGVPHVTRCVGVFLLEVAEWFMANSWPPLNALAVNAQAQQPGDGYDGAPGCSLVDWEKQARDCIAFDGYPRRVR